MDQHPVLEARGISKRFQDVLANDRIDFDLRAGEIHALLGENGAGKSTLMNIICGLYAPDEGEIFVEGRRADIRGPRDAIRTGIGMVHQHFMLVPVFSVAENIILGKEFTRGPYLDLKRARRKILQISRDHGLQVDPDAIIENLPVGIQQRVEIIKALFRGAKILILDEPTSVLTPREAKDLFQVMHRLAQRGVCIIFITHKLDEVMEVADRISVLRRGRMIATTRPAETDKNQLAALMVGHDVQMQIDRCPANPGKVILTVEHLSVLDARNVPAVNDVSLDISAGEIFGLAGVQGNGQTELALALTGLQAIQGGIFLLSGQKIKTLGPRARTELGMAHIPEDRQKHGLIMQYSIADNQVLCSYYRQPFARGLKRNNKAVWMNSRRLIEQFDIRAAGPEALAGSLSGGNQQKVIVSRELSRDIRLLIANQPTRGLDVGSIEYIHRQILELRDNGVAILLISVELDEIMSLSDRIGVMVNGHIAAIFKAGEVSKEQLGYIMTGAKRNSESGMRK